MTQVLEKNIIGERAAGRNCESKTTTPYDLISRRGRLIRLFDLVELIMAEPVSITEMFVAISLLEHLSNRGEVIKNEQDWEAFHSGTSYSGLMSFVHQLGLTSTATQLGRIKPLWSNDHEKVTAEDVRNFLGRFRDDLASTLLLSVDVQSRILFREPTSNWDEVINQWPDAVYDVEEASKCLALDRSTAAVFHLSRIAEQGLREACAKYIPAADLPQAPRQSMGDYLRVIKEFNDVRPPKPTGAIELSEAAAYFSPIKNIWRDNVSHTGVKYTETEAERIYNAVRDMLTICAKIL